MSPRIIASGISLAVVVRGWNQDVHYASAKLTEDLLDEGALDALLQKRGDLTYYINWPDANHRAGSMSGDPNRFGWSLFSHFVNSEPGEPYDPVKARETRTVNEKGESRETPNAVNSMIHFHDKLLHYKSFELLDYVSEKMKAADKALYDAQPVDFLKNTVLERFKREATYSISHYFQDIHNPFHCADAHDMGGFKHTMVCQFCEDRLKRTNIHSVWDADMFDHELREVFEYDYVDQMENFELDRYPFAQKLYYLMKERYQRLEETKPEQLEEWTAQCSGDFGRCIDTAVGETREFYVDNEKELYAGEKDGVVTKAYLDKYLEKAFEQVIKASVRLAAALNKMAKDLSETKGEKQRDEPAPTSPPPKMRANRSPARERSRSRSRSPVKKH
ncbi:hypothetical protein FOZ60_011272 [Perkinsus olseni]|uniref:Uncharacterized protein n=2 Tax=Perkinsus olseni TaxID=32597 RepID=A0A7J6PAV0_PEROL|nr:hypothetical protein FOZ60_011272 [Perkinsus olseni]